MKRKHHVVRCETTEFKLEVSLHDIGLKIRKINNIYKNRFSKSYEDLIGKKDIFVTIDGDIYHISTGNLITRTNPDGYLMVAVAGHTFLLHRLVAMAFCAMHFAKNKIVCHKNKIRTDNRAVNLMWTDRTFISKRRTSWETPNLGRPIIAYKGSFIKRYDNANKAMDELGVYRGNIYKVCKGERHTAGGYKFKYADLEKTND